MVLRSAWSPLFLICVGCQGLVALEPDAGSVAATTLWEQGQAAMREGQTARAIDFYEQSLAADPAFTRNQLSLAAAYLESGNDVEACAHLASYVAAHPEHLVIRTHYAELLLRLHRVQEGCAEFERFIADMQEQQDDDVRALIHCHSRLMEVGEATEDEYAVHLHRGIGLYLLARERVATDEPEGDLPTEGLLCKAAGELSVAHTLRPGDARPCWYLYAVWSRLGQQQPARRCLHEAEAAAPFSYLTPAEQRSLQLAARGPETDGGQR
jgi:tetratricopeptide (TPR) repeat protein